MKVENKTTSAASSAGTKPASQKPSPEAKKTGTPVTAEKPSATPDKISTEDKYEKETKSDKKEEFFDNVSSLRSMSGKDSLKKEEKPEKLDKDKERKNLITSILSVSRDALRVAKSAIDKLSSCGDNMPCGKTDEQTDPYSVINKAALEVPEDTKKLLDNLFVMTAAEVKDNVAPSEKKGEEKLTEGTVKEFQNKHEELRNEWKKRQKFLDKGSDRERTIKNPDGTETRISTRKKTDAQEGDYSLYELREEKDKSGKTTSSKSSLLNRDNDGNFTEHSVEQDSKGNEIITDSKVKSDGSTDEKVYEKKNEPPPPGDRERTRQERDEIKHKFTRGKTTVKEDVKNPDGTKTFKVFERSTVKPEVKESEETERKDRNGHIIKDKSSSTYIHNEDGSETKVYERDDGLGNKEYSKLTMKDGGISERESVTTKSDGTVIKSKEITDSAGKKVIVSDEERPDGSKIHKEKTVEYKSVKDSVDDKSSKTADKKSSTDKSVIPDKTTVPSSSTDVSKTESKDKRVEEKAPQTTYDPGKESEVLNNAMSGWGANKEAIYNVLKGKSPEELKALKESYKAKYGKELEEAVKSELKGVDLDKAKALLEKGNFSQADNIKQSLDSWSIRKGDIVKILDGKSPDEIKAIKEEYKKTCGTELDEDLNKTLLMSPIEKEKIKLLMKGEPQADMNIKDPKEREADLIKRKGEFTASKIELDIKALMSVPPPPKSYETKALLDTLYGKSPEEIKAYKDAYKKATGKDLEKTIDILLITSPSNRAIAKSYMTQGKETDAEKLHRAMAGTGANANLIFKTLEGKSDAERKAIIEDYKKKYGKDLPCDLKEQLGGANLEKAQALLEKGPCYELNGEKLKGKIPDDKLKLIEKSILNKEFSEKDLREKLAKSGLNEQDIETVLKDSKKDNLDSNTKLNIAMDRWGADKEAIFDTLQEASPETRQEILNNKDMMKKLRGELNDKDYAQAMGYLNSNQSGEVPLKDKLKSSMAGWGTDKNSFYEALDKASPEEIASLKNDPELNKLFDSELNKEDREKLNNIIKEGKVSAKIKIKNSISFTGEDEKKIYEALEKATPEERKELMNDPEIKEIFAKNLDAREMSNVNLIMDKRKLPAKTKIEQASKGAGTIEKDIFEALEKATPEERKELQKDPSIKKLLEEELGGNDLLRARILLEKGKTEPADDLYMAMKGAGTDRDAIYKALSSCKNNEEKDKLINTYRNKYNRDLQADLKEELAGTDYYKTFDMLQKEPKNLEERKEQMTEKLSRGRNSGDVWSQVSNNIMDVFSEEGRNVDDSERELRDTYKQVEKIEKQGGKPDAKLLEKLDEAENKVKVNIDDYEESKNKVADGLSTAASITAAVATSAVVTLATGGVGSVAVPLIIGSAITCATTKVAINKIVKGNSYDLNSTQALTDFTTGAVEGALNAAGGPLMDKFCKLPALQKITVMSTIMKNPVITKALSKGTIEGVTSFVENKAVQEIVKDAITDAVTSGVQGGLTTAMDEGTWSDGIGEGLLKVGESGAVQGGVGLATSVAMGTTLKAGEHILGKFKPKADTPDGLDVKLKDPEKFSKAKKILSEGSHSETELTQKLKEAGFKDEDIQSVLEHKSSVKTPEKPVTEEPSVKEGKKETAGEVKESGAVEQSGEVKKSGHEEKIDEKSIKKDMSDIKANEDISETPLKFDDLSEEEKKLVRDQSSIQKEIKEKYTEPHKLSFFNKDKKEINIDFYGGKRQIEIVQEGINFLPPPMKEEFLTKIQNGEIKEILVGDFIYERFTNKTISKEVKNKTISKGVKGLFDPNTGNIIFNNMVLGKNFLLVEEEIKKVAPQFFTEAIEGKTIREINETIIKLEKELTTSASNIDEITMKLNIMREYKNAVNLNKNDWINTFNHEFGHKFDDAFKRIEKVPGISEDKLKSAFRDEKTLEKIKQILEERNLLNRRITSEELSSALEELTSDKLSDKVSNNIIGLMKDENFDLEQLEKFFKIQKEKYVDLSYDALDAIGIPEGNVYMDKLTDSIHKDLAGEKVTFGDLDNILYTLKGQSKNRKNLSHLTDWELKMLQKDLKNKLNVKKGLLTSNDVAKIKNSHTLEDKIVLLSQREGSPFLNEKSWGITKYASSARKPEEAMAETLNILLEERRRFVAGKKGLITETDNIEFISRLQASPYRDEYNYILNNVLSKDGNISWPDIKNYKDYEHLLEDKTVKQKWDSILNNIKNLKKEEETIAEVASEVSSELPCTENFLPDIDELKQEKNMKSGNLTEDSKIIPEQEKEIKSGNLTEDSKIIPDNKIKEEIKDKAFVKQGSSVHVLQKDTTLAQNVIKRVNEIDWNDFLSHIESGYTDKRGNRIREGIKNMKRANTDKNAFIEWLNKTTNIYPNADTSYKELYLTAWDYFLKQVSKGKILGKRW